MAQFQQEDFNHLPRLRRPVFFQAQQGLQSANFNPGHLGFFEAHPVVAQVRAQPVAHLGAPPDGLVMSQQPVPPLLSFEIRNPNLFGGAGQIGFANAHRADLVIIGMGLFEPAQMSTFQDLGLA